MSTLHKFTTVMILSLYLIGCGGSGSGGDGDGDGDFPTPALPAGAVKIDADNAEDIAESALLFTEAIASVSAKTEGPPSIQQVIKLVFDRVTKRNRNSGSVTAGKTEDLSAEFCDTGTAMNTYTEDGNSATGNIKLTDCAIGGIAVVNGTVPYEGSEDPVTQDYSSEFGGTLTFDFDVGIEQFTVTVVLDFIESGNDGTGAFSFSPSFSLDGIPGGGYLVTTVQPLMGVFDDLTSGVLNVEGADNTRLCMTVTFINTVTVGFDDGLGGGCVPLVPPLDILI